MLEFLSGLSLTRLALFLSLSALHLLTPILDELVHVDVYPQPLLAHRRVNTPQFGGIHLSRQCAEGLHEDILGPGAGLDSAVEDGLGLGAQFPPRVAEADISDPEPHVVLTDVGGQ